MNTAAPQSDVFLACIESLADPTRLRLLRLLEQQELGVAELCQVLQMPQSTVSRHLKVLAGQGWTVSRRNGTANLYRMVFDELPEPAHSLWEVARRQVEHQPTFQQDQLRLKHLLQSRREDAKRFFSGAAAEWARLREDLYGSRFTEDAILALLPSNWVIADLGCGSADFAARLAGHVKHVIGVDNTPEMLKAARGLAKELPNLDIRRGDLEDVPVETGSCDAAVMMLVLTYIPVPEQVLAELARVLRPGGKAVIVDLMRHDRDDFRREMGQACNGFEQGQLCRMLETVGLTDPHCVPLPPEPDARGPALLLASATRQH